MGASPVWHKSSYSGGLSGDCVQIARTRNGVLVGDSKHPTCPALRLSASAWTRFVDHVTLASSVRAA
ncbi:DUF397 domain-containing protein [Streptomyces sp. NPDC093568]|uniref:DUF397 domain-containing protein n=1 Tax=Streptomyces sp. NPDC093568 TaxID=3366041 RepID=UPI0037F1AB73